MKFSFGQNWLSYAQRALSEERVNAARNAFHILLDNIPLRGRRFLDVGFGQGLALFFAAEAGAEVTGLDLDPLCQEAVAATAPFFPNVSPPKIIVGSILDAQQVVKLRGDNGYDVVHSWGVLHHTGNMYKSIENAAWLVAPRGHLIVSIYNRHWTSPLWRSVKRVFNVLPRFLQEFVAYLFYPIFAWRARSLKREGEAGNRGMDAAHDLQDWLGGYPYEYASRQEVTAFIAGLGFALLRSYPTEGFTGCNEFVFRRAGAAPLSS